MCFRPKGLSYWDGFIEVSLYAKKANITGGGLWNGNGITVKKRIFFFSGSSFPLRISKNAIKRQWHQRICPMIEQSYLIRLLLIKVSFDLFCVVSRKTIMILRWALLVLWWMSRSCVKNTVKICLVPKSILSDSSHVGRLKFRSRSEDGGCHTLRGNVGIGANFRHTSILLFSSVQLYAPLWHFIAVKSTFFGADLVPRFRCRRHLGWSCRKSMKDSTCLSLSHPHFVSDHRDDLDVRILTTLINAQLTKLWCSRWFFLLHQRI